MKSVKKKSKQIRNTLTSKESKRRRFRLARALKAGEISDYISTLIEPMSKEEL